MTELRISRWAQALEGEFDSDRLRAKLEATGYSVCAYTYPPGTCFPAHTHAVDKCDAVVSGRFEITCGAESVILEAGDMVFIPAGTEHAAEVVGDEAVISLDGIVPDE